LWDVVNIPVLARFVFGREFVLVTLETDFVGVRFFDTPLVDVATFTRLDVIEPTVDLPVLFLRFETQVFALTTARCWSMFLVLAGGYLWLRAVVTF